MSPFFKRFLIISGLLIVLAVVFVWKWVFQEQSKSIGSVKADLTISSDMLVKDFMADEKTANAKYLNKIIEVKGTINDINDTGSEINVVLKKTGDSSGVVCSFDKSALDKSLLKIGNMVTIKGICSGYLMDVVLNRCALDK